MTTPLQLTRVGLHRFKAAYDLHDVPLRPFNVIIGRNGVGKSTLLEALQWIDTAVRSNTNTACDRYNGITDLINHRSAKGERAFEIALRWEATNGSFARFGCTISEDDVLGWAEVTKEELRIGTPAKPVGQQMLRMDGHKRIGTHGTIAAPDRLALARLDEILPGGTAIAGRDIVAFWRDAVFLRLAPTELAKPAALKRPSGAPLLDEVGATLPALIEELDSEARSDLLDMLQSVLPDFRAVDVVRASDSRAGSYALKEDILFKGRTGRKQFSIPSWMLSEGTRRMTAIFALLAHRPGPSLLCIEEVENGLDPVSVRKVLSHLKEASTRGVQVILTTHSPWLLDDVDLEDVLVVRRALGDTAYTRLKDDPTSQQSDPRVLPGGRYIDLLEG